MVQLDVSLFDVLFSQQSELNYYIALVKLGNGIVLEVTKKSVNIIKGFCEHLFALSILLLVGFKADQLDLFQSLLIEFVMFATCGVAIVVNGV